jgi:hypothetical protein
MEGVGLKKIGITLQYYCITIAVGATPVKCSVVTINE